MKIVNGLPVVELAVGSTTTIGMAGVRCVECGDLVPVAIEAEIAPDEDGDPCLFTKGSTFEMEAHLLRHVAAAEDAT